MTPQRINFLERGRYALTYQNMALFLGCWIVLCAAVHGLFIMRGVWMRTKVIASEQLVKALEAEFQKQVHFATASQTVERTGAAVQSLSSVFQQVPRWSRALKELAEALPAQVWLSSVKTTVASGTTGRMIEVEGRGRSAEAITQFVQRLDAMPLFANAILARSTKDAEQSHLYFTVAAEVRFTGL
ncbi:MAG: PilN domain-containing protein [Deltaproteobacteria bacterium]|nr:PilN domain-containing protein [Deltaproteobacteria bacterium]